MNLFPSTQGHRKRANAPAFSCHLASGYCPGSNGVENLYMAPSDREFLISENLMVFVNLIVQRERIRRMTSLVGGKLTRFAALVQVPVGGMIDTTQTRTLTCGLRAEDKGWEFHLSAFSHFQVDGCDVHLAVQAGDPGFAVRKQSKISCPVEQRPPGSGRICLLSSIFPSAQRRPFSCCLWC